ncbi:DNA-directed RNA polymerase III subunit RPC10 [Angomonas deanei]|uniref:DNA-directed RNA polymerase subunit n=1 Tax=Angomonas deanei TaxID=59799 RepID=A0A7G2CF31_9TRYP|nr:DNA-directed RNA polymerase III subunit RPC10 [Angomonas deanei]CAD2217484.1 RNA polymerases M/15 Kd subunit/Transcription factor S-II (TFIIS), putative [Angomonas deanei]|eukprot:EPY31261.1 DNA-directed RNA polymerase III subunit RPC10 [Angomonas deanei]
MFFCPFCGTLLLLQEQESSFVCSTCTYVHRIREGAPLTITHDFSDSNKKMDDIEDGMVSHDVSGEGQIITMNCQNEKSLCDSSKAYYIQVQMRSADEPPTTFFKCVKCGFQWRQD